MMNKDVAQQTLPGHVDVVVAVIGIAIGISISCLNFIYANEYLVTMGPVLAVACLGYIIFRRKLLSDTQPSPEAGTTFILTLSVLFWITFAGSLFSLSTGALHRPLIYFVLTSLSAVMIALQILYYRGKGSIFLILLEILVLSLSIRASAFCVFPNIPGIDSWWHMMAAEDYTVQGHMLQYLNTTGGENHYYSMPVMHFNVAATQLLTGVDSKTAMFLGAGIPLLLSTVFVFLIGRSLGNVKVGLLAALLLNLSDYHVAWGAGNIIAMSIGIVLFTIILYLLVVGNRNALLRKGLIILLFIGLIFTHTVSAFIMVTFLLVAAVGTHIYKYLYRDHFRQNGSLLTFSLTGLCIVAMIVHWNYVYISIQGQSFFDTMADWFYISITQKAELLVTRAPSIAAEFGWIGPIMNISGYLLLLLLGIVGCLIWLSWKHQTETKTALIAALTIMIGLPLSFPLFGIGNIEPTRWPAFYYVIVTVAAAVTLLTFTEIIKYRKLAITVISCVVFGYSFFMITDSVANTDSPVYAAYLNERHVYTESEVAAAEFVKGYDGIIVVDNRYSWVLTVSGVDTGIMSVDMKNRELVDESMVIWRDILDKRPASILSETGSLRLSVLGESYKQELETSNHLIYCNKDMKIYLGTNVPIHESE